MGDNRSTSTLFTWTFCWLLCPLFATFSYADFRGKTIEWIVPFKEGGGTDTWARYVAPFLSKHLPGNPEVNVINLPGGGGTRAANKFSEQAGPDGLSILGSSASTLFPFLLGDPRVKYDYRDWRVLMVYWTSGVTYTTPEFGIDTIADIGKLRNNSLVYGSQGTTSSDLAHLLGFELLGLEVKAIIGMRGRGAARLAFEKGDVTIDFQTTAAYIKNVQPLVDSGRAVPLFSSGILNEKGRLIRDPAFPELPHFLEVYESIHGETPSGLAWESWFAFYKAGYGAHKLLVVPRETPEHIVKMYQDSVRSMKRDPEFIATSNQAIGPYEQVTGEAAQRLYRLATGVSEEHREWVRNWLRTRYKLNI